MRGRVRAVAIVVVLVIGALSVPAAAQETILVLHVAGYDTVGRIPFDAAFARTLRERTDVQTDLYIESLEINRLGGPAQAATLRTYLRERYAGKRIGVVVAVLDEALDFVLDPKEPLFPGVPIAAALTGRRESLPDRAAQIWWGNSTGASVELALRLHPRTRQIAVVSTSSLDTNSESVFAADMQQIEAAARGVPIIRLHNLPRETVLARVNSLPPDTILFALRQYLGRGGVPITNDEALRELSKAANAPLYVRTFPQIGTGAVGGMVINIEDEARQLAQLALRLAAGEQRIAPVEAAAVPTFDWRQLRRWGINERALPRGSDVRFRELGLWDQYRWLIVGALTVGLIQTALIIGLLLQRRRRRTAEVALHDRTSALEASTHQVQSLAGRLITAQEVERRRIARELHDDLSQQLALLSIEFDQLAANGNADFRMQADAVSQRVGDIAVGVHNLSHELHPSRLETLGLGIALQGLCREMSAAHRTRIDYELHPLPLIPDTVALSLFRVTQEALRNVVKHSGAQTAAVRLQSNNGRLELEITDAGRGFAAGANGDGIGLVSMRERVSLVGGEFTVEARAGRGTRILVHVPLPQEGVGPLAHAIRKPAGAPG